MAERNIGKWKQYKNRAGVQVDVGEHDRVREKLSINVQSFDEYQVNEHRIESWTNEWSNQLVPFCCTFPYCMHAALCCPLIVIAPACVNCIIDPLDRLCCNNWCECVEEFNPKRVPEWAEEAMIITNIGIHGHNQHGNQTSLTWDNIKLEETEITTGDYSPFPVIGDDFDDFIEIMGCYGVFCCLCLCDEPWPTLTNIRKGCFFTVYPAPLMYQGQRLETSCNIGFGILLPCCKVPLRQISTANYLLVKIASFTHKDDDIHISALDIEAKKLREILIDMTENHEKYNEYEYSHEEHVDSDFQLTSMASIEEGNAHLQIEMIDSKMSYLYCPHCDNKVKGLKFCDSCGEELKGQQ